MFLGYSDITFLGHTVGWGLLSPEREKMAKLMKLKAPTSKKQVRSLIGLLNYYRRFVPHFASLASVFSDLLKGGGSNRVEWTTECQSNLDCIVSHLTSHPILILPDFTEQFILRTDASDAGLGACLLPALCVLRTGELWNHTDYYFYLELSTYLAVF